MSTLGLWLYLEGEGEKEKSAGDLQVSWESTGWKLRCRHSREWCGRSRRWGQGAERSSLTGTITSTVLYASHYAGEGKLPKQTNTFTALKSGARKNTSKG